jgi:hypothetical protein
MVVVFLHERQEVVGALNVPFSSLVRIGASNEEIVHVAPPYGSFVTAPLVKPFLEISEHESCEHGRGVFHSEVQDVGLIGAQWCFEGGLPTIFRVNGDIIVSPSNVEL